LWRAWSLRHQVLLLEDEFEGTDSSVVFELSLDVVGVLGDVVGCHCSVESGSQGFVVRLVGVEDRSGKQLNYLRCLEGPILVWVEHVLSKVAWRMQLRIPLGSISDNSWIHLHVFV